MDDKRGRVMGKGSGYLGGGHTFGQDPQGAERKMAFRLSQLGLC